MHAQYHFSESTNRKRRGTSNEGKWGDAVDACYKQGNRPANTSDNHKQTEESDEEKWTGIIAFPVISAVPSKYLNDFTIVCSHYLQTCMKSFFTGKGLSKCLIAKTV